MAGIFRALVVKRGHGMPAFSDRYIKGLKPGSKKYVVREGVGAASRGFCLRVMPSGTKTWYYTYKVDGKERWERLGQYPSVGLAEARELYLAARARRERGESVAALVVSNYGSFGQLADEYIDDMRQRGRVSADMYRTQFDNHVFRVIDQQKPAREVTAADIRLVLHNKIKDGALYFSNRLRSMMLSAFKFGIEYDNDPRFLNRPMVFGISSNPVANVPGNPGAEKPGNRVLSEAELKFHFENFGGAYGYCHRLMILLGGQRPIDVLSLRRGDLDIEARILDPSRASQKNQRVNVLPLSDWVLSMLAGLKMMTGATEYLFPRGLGGRSAGADSSPYMTLSGNSRAVNKFIKNNSLKNYDSRDLRRTAKTLMGKAGIPKVTRDLLQNHNRGDVSSVHYDRYDYLAEKREALVVWENYLRDVIKISNT